MSRYDGHFEKILLSILLHFLLFSLAAGAVSAQAHPDGSCVAAAGVPLDAVVRNAGTRQCYAVEVPSPGLLAIELSPAGSDGVETRLDDFAHSCGVSDVKRAVVDTLERRANRQLLTVRSSGAYRFCVSAQDPDEILAGSKLSVVFVGAWVTKDGDPREEEPDPDLLVQDPSLSGLRERFRDACRALAADDHGDSFLCATRLQLGAPVEGEIWNAWGDDEDIFVFTLDELTTVRLEATAERGVVGGLYDQYGHRLHVEARGDDGDWYAVSTLAPGSYAVRLTGYDGLGGAYRLQLVGLKR